jgi:hypothetical protein
MVAILVIVRVRGVGGGCVRVFRIVAPVPAM